MMLLLFIQIAVGPVPAEQLSLREGTVEVIGRYREFLDRQLSLYDCPVVFSIDSPTHASLILSLAAGKDNLTLRGRFDTADPKHFAVESVVRAPSDVELYQERAKTSSRTSAELLTLGRDALSRAERFHDDALRETGVTFLREGFLARRKESAGDAEKSLAWLQEMVGILKDTGWALRETQDILQGRPGWEKAETFLRSLGCVKWRGNWLSEEEFMKAQGYVSMGGRWVLPQDVDFTKARAVAEKSIADHTILRMHTDEYYRLRSEQGKLLVGMTREEAVSAWGFPDEARRVAVGKAALDQWRFGSRLVYLLDGHVFQVPSPDENASPGS